MGIRQENETNRMCQFGQVAMENDVGQKVVLEQYIELLQRGGVTVLRV
jgi:hypothetical protein